MTSEAALSPFAQHALAAFEHVVGHTSGFRARPGQHAMAQCVADTLSRADLGECDDPTKAIASKGDVKVVAQPGGKRDVPASPEILD